MICIIKQDQNWVSKKQKHYYLQMKLGFIRRLTGFKELYDDGSLGIMNGVGYPNPDRSHFRSMDIWQTGEPEQQSI